MRDDRAKHLCHLTTVDDLVLLLRTHKPMGSQREELLISIDNAKDEVLKAEAESVERVKLAREAETAAVSEAAKKALALLNEPGSEQLKEEVDKAKAEAVKAKAELEKAETESVERVKKAREAQRVAVAEAAKKSLAVDFTAAETGSEEEGVRRSVTGMVLGEQKSENWNKDNEWDRMMMPDPDLEKWGKLGFDPDLKHYLPQLKHEEMTPDMFREMDPDELKSALGEIGIDGETAMAMRAAVTAYDHHPSDDDTDEEVDDDNRIVDITDGIEKEEDQWEMTAEERALFVADRTADARKYANELFKSGKLDEAGYAYKKLLRLCSAAADKLALQTNVAAVRLKQERWKDARKACDAALAIDAAHIKAYYRKAQAMRGLGEFEEGLEVIAKAVVVLNGKLNKELEELHQGIKKDIEDKEEAYKRKVYEKSRKKYIKRMTERYEEERAKAIKDGRIDPVKEEEEMERRRIERMIAKEDPESLEREARKQDLRQAARDEAMTPKLKPNSKATLRWPQLPAAPEPEGEIGDRDMTAWFRARLIQRLINPDARGMIHEHMGYGEVRDLPEDALKVSAAIVAGPDGKRGLYYDVSLTALVLCAFYAVSDGCFQFLVKIKLYNVDNTTECDEDAWVLEASIVEEKKNKDDERLPGFYEHIEENYLEHFKTIIREAIFGLRNKCYNSLKNGTAPEPTPLEEASSLVV